MNTESLFSMWARIGVSFPAFETSKKEPLIEDLIAQTSLIGRYEPRLLEGMAGWIQKHGDLINTSLMHKYLSESDSAVIGLISEVLTSKEAQKFKQLSKNCCAKEKAEMLFYSAEKSAIMKAQAIENEAEINRKWNLYYVSLRIKTDAVINRSEVLKRNHNLARRSLFGTEMKTEILNYLLEKGTSFQAQIAKDLRYRYHRVTEDAHKLLRDGVLIESSYGRKKELKLLLAFLIILLLSLSNMITAL